MGKLYYEFMDEISKEELYEKMVRYGLFTEKLPDFLDTATFWECCKNKTCEFQSKEYDFVKFESMRNNFIPRIFGIPTPMAHERLCKCIADYWEEIKEKFKENTQNDKYKISRVHIRKMQNKNQLFEMNYDNYKIDGFPEMEILIGKKFLVKTDISTCFSSIYTHALSWALVGKENAKLNKNKSRLWYNKLDKCARQEKYDETHGLIIGPHTSNILSEIILTKVDKEMVEQGYEYVRNINDYCCYVDDEQSAKKFMEDLSRVLKKYDLFLNHKKTTIIKLPISSKNEWVRKLNSFQFNEGKVKFPIIRSYLDMAVDLTEKFKDVAIFKYAIKVINNKQLTSNAEDYFIKTIFHYALIYHYLIPLLDKKVFEKYRISNIDMESIVNKIYEEGINNKNYEALMFGIYYAVKYNVKIKNIKVEELLIEDNCLVPLLGYIYFEDDKKNKEKIKKYAEKLKDLGEMDRNWLFIYEVLSANDFKDDWKNLKAKKVSFVKKNFKK